VPDEKGSSFAYASYSEAAKAVQDKISASYKISPAYNLMEQSVPEYSGLINDEVKTD